MYPIFFFVAHLADSTVIPRSISLVPPVTGVWRGWKLMGSSTKKLINIFMGI